MTHGLHRISALVSRHRGLLLISTVVTFVALLCTVASAKGKINVTVGQSVTHKLGAAMGIVKTVSIANSDVADVVVAGPREVLINGIDIGRTTLVIWDETHRSALFDVVVRGPYSDQQIEIRVKIAEVNRTRAFELGIDYLFSFEQDNGAQWAGGLFGGSVSTPSNPLPFFGGSGVEGLTGALKYVKGTTTLATAIHALVSNGVLHVLAEPNVVAASGQEASFLSGGEIPVPIASAGATGGATVTIEWKEFGVKVLFIPTIVDSGVISMYIAPEVSSLDYANAVEVSGFRIPALRTRKAQTTVELKDQETLVIGGLFLEEETRVRTRVPILGHIPLLGYLFSDTRNVKTVSELILVISPRIIHAHPPGVVVPLPEISDRDDKNQE